MAKKAITFQSGWSRYNAGETAAFEARQADDLVKQGIAVLATTQPKPDTITVSLGIDPRETEAFKEAIAEIARAGREVQDRAASLDQREADLVARAAALDGREAELAAREAALVDREKAAAVPPAEGEKPAGAETDKPADQDAEKQSEPAAKSTGLPKQGR